MISQSEAVRIAAREMQLSPILMDPLYAPWRAASLGEPVLVSTLNKQPSYWLVPVELSGRSIGFVRVNGEGRVSAMGAYYRDPARLDVAPIVVTMVEAAEAARQAASYIDPAQGETALAPVFVHDGPPGREAWLVEVVRNHQLVRALFVTPGGVYERPVGSDPDEKLE